MSSPGLNPTRLSVIGHGEVSLNVWDYGGNGPNLLLCHCTGTCARVWDPVVADLLENFRVLAVDSRGHGDSDKPEDMDAYVWKHSGADLCAVVAHLDLGDEVYAAGHSSGAAHIAYAQLQQPGIFSRIMLIDGIIAPPNAPLSADYMADSARRRRFTFDSKAEALERFSSKPPKNTWHPECLQAYVTHGLTDNEDGSASLKCLPEIESTIYERGGASDAFERLAELDSSRVSLVTGDSSMAKILIELQHQILPKATFHEVPNASHFVPQECPADINRLIREDFRA